ncbi:transcription elongation factor GreA [Candidatus Uhrbacteria bacterium]|nr:transcription elongation factor GreA [Candidatus Uhrbacteria bacterium]
MATYLSQEKLDEMKKELEHRSRVQRKEIAERIASAKELGDLSENFEYHEAKEQQAQNESRVVQLQDMIRDVVLVEEKSGGDRIGLGSRFVVSREKTEKTFEIVGANEANPVEGKISNESPIGHAFMGKRVGENVTIDIPSGNVSYTIVKIL